MRLWERFKGLEVFGTLRLGKNANIKVVQASGSENTVSLTELQYVDGLTAGTVTASKAVLVDANKDIGDFRNLDVTNLDAGLSGTAGSVDVFPSTASKGKLAITCTDQTGDTTVSLVAGAMGAARTITIPDPGAAANVLMSTGTATATDATSAEITRACDVSARIVNTTATTLSITEATHEGKVVTVNSAAPIAITLPASSGGGAKYTFVVGTAATATAHTIKVANTADILAGIALVAQTDTTQVNGFLTTATDDTISLNGTTKGGLKGDRIEVIDVASGVFQVTCWVGASGTVATPFSATV